MGVKAGYVSLQVGGNTGITGHHHHPSFDFPSFRLRHRYTALTTYAGGATLVGRTPLSSTGAQAGKDVPTVRAKPILAGSWARRVIVLAFNIWSRAERDREAACCFGGSSLVIGESPLFLQISHLENSA